MNFPCSLRGLGGSLRALPFPGGENLAKIIKNKEGGHGIENIPAPPLSSVPHTEPALGKANNGIPGDNNGPLSFEARTMRQWPSVRSLHSQARPARAPGGSRWPRGATAVAARCPLVPLRPWLRGESRGVPLPLAGVGFARLRRRKRREEVSLPSSGFGRRGGDGKVPVGVTGAGPGEQRRFVVSGGGRSPRRIPGESESSSSSSWRWEPARPAPRRTRGGEGQGVPPILRGLESLS